MDIRKIERALVEFGALFGAGACHRERFVTLLERRGRLDEVLDLIGEARRNSAGRMPPYRSVPDKSGPWRYRTPDVGSGLGRWQACDVLMMQSPYGITYVRQDDRVFPVASLPEGTEWGESDARG